jgi:ATP-binding cassette subfamily F protein 3
MLLLDEPTNHLDLRAKDVLLDAIRNFSGTVLFVSHDRYFIDGLATRVFEVEERRVHIYPGNYEDYLWRKQGGPEKVAESLKPVSVAVAAPASVVAEPAAVPKVGVKKLNPIKLKMLEDEVSEAETRVLELEEQIAAAEAASGVYTTAEEAQRVAAELESLRAEQELVLARWEDLGTQLELQRD